MQAEVLSGSALRLMQELAKGVSGVVILAQNLSLSERQVQRLLRQLVRLCAIDPLENIQGGRGKMTTYHVTLSVFPQMPLKGDMVPERVTSPTIKGDMHPATEAESAASSSVIATTTIKGDIASERVTSPKRVTPLTAAERTAQIESNALAAFERATALAAAQQLRREKGDIAPERVTSPKSGIGASAPRTRARGVDLLSSRGSLATVEHGQSQLLREKSLKRPTQPTSGDHDLLPEETLTPRGGVRESVPPFTTIQAILAKVGLAMIPENIDPLMRRLKAPCGAHPSMTVYAMLRSRGRKLPLEAVRAVQDYQHKGKDQRPVSGSLIGAYLANYALDAARERPVQRVVATN